MAYEDSLRSITLNADGSLAEYTGIAGAPGSASPNYGKQYRFVKLVGARACGLVTATTDIAVGVLQNKPQVVGQEATVGIRGISNVMTGEALAATDLVKPDDEGRAVKTTTASEAVGIVVDSTANDENQLVSVLLMLRIG